MPDEPPITQQAQGSYIAQATHGGMATVQVVLPPAPVQEQNRVRMLSRLRYRYDEEWEQSLEGAGLLMLGLVNKPDAVLHHTGLLFLSPQQPERPLPPGTSIAQVYDQAGQDLLILGEPGAGKSTLLLDLARRLVECAEQDAAQPFPVILPLSTWAVKRQPLTDWLSEQLTQLYSVPRRLSHSWVQTDQLLLLLDGFDEVPQEARVACIQAIAAYREEHLVPIVVCSRRTEFEEIPRQQRLVMQSAVVVQPLTQEQVGAYLLQGGEAFSALRMVLHSNPVLAELVTTPLMLHVLTLTYTGTKARDLPQGGSPEEQQRRIFASYVERMIERRRNRISFPLQRIISWLSWLARQMKEQSQSIFYLEQMQPSWLDQSQGSRAYNHLAIRLPYILIGALLSLLVNLLFLNVNAQTYQNIASLLYAVIHTGIISALLGGLLGGLLSEKEIIPFLTKRRAGNLWWSAFMRSVRNGVLVGLGVGLNVLWFRWPPQEVPAADRLLFLGQIYGASFGLLALLLSLIYTVLAARNKTERPEKETEMVSNEEWWKRVFKAYHVRNGILLGLGVALSYGMSEGIWWGTQYVPPDLSSSPQIIVGVSTFPLSGLSYGMHRGLVAGMGEWLTYGLTCTLLGVIIAGIPRTIVPTEMVVWSWRKLWQSLFHISHWRNVGLLMFLFGLVVGLDMLFNMGVSLVLKDITIDSNDWLLTVLLNWLGSMFTSGLFIGLSFWLLVGLYQGWSGEALNDQQRVKPNQGIRRSIRSAILMGLIGGGIVGLFYVLGKTLYTFLIEVYSALSLGAKLSGALSLALSITQLTIPSLIIFWLPLGLMSAVLVGLLSGGLASLRHGVLRLLLWRGGAMPWHYVRFLDEAAGCILLRKVGGGYMFVHRLILDYFASLENPLTKPELPQPSQAVPPRLCSACGYQEEHPGARFCAGCGKSLAS